VGEAPDGFSLLEQLEATPVDVLLLDISMPGPGFLELMSRIRTRHPQVKILVVSMHPEAYYAERALKAGARGYVSKQQSVEELSRAIIRVHAGATYVSGRPEQPPTRTGTASLDGSPVQNLSSREFEILVMLANGQGITQIAGALSLSPKTVSTYRLRVLQKLRLETNADLVRYAVENQIIA
jgi:DNA-binding NarL/FixJ family response regulator